MNVKIGTLFALLVAVVSTIVRGNRYSEPFNCYGDICNLHADAQFCDIIERKCRQCYDVRDDCFTRLQTFNCSQFCYDVRYELDVEKLRVAGCDVPPPPRNGNYSVSTTHVPYDVTLEVTCYAGFEVRQFEPFRCSNYSMWSGSKPECEVVVCTIPTPPEHGRYNTAATSVAVNGTLEFTCDPGYEPGSQDTLKCGSNSTWNGPKPVCNSKGRVHSFSTLSIALCVLLFLFVAVSIISLTIVIKQCRGRAQNTTKHAATTDAESKPLMENNNLRTDNSIPITEGNTECKMIHPSDEKHTEINNDWHNSQPLPPDGPVYVSSFLMESDTVGTLEEGLHSASGSTAVTQPEERDNGENVKIDFKHVEFHPEDIDFCTLIRHKVPSLM